MLLVGMCHRAVMRGCGHLRCSRYRLMTDSGLLTDLSAAVSHVGINRILKHIESRLSMLVPTALILPNQAAWSATLASSAGIIE